MAFEKSGFNINVTCSQDATLTLSCRTKQRPGVKVSDKIDLTTDRTTSCKVFEPGNLFEVTDGKLTVIDDPAIAAKILAVLGVKGTITFTGKTTNISVVYANAWFASYVPDEVGLNGALPTATITIQSAGTMPANS